MCEAIKAGLETLRKLDPDCRLFGVSEHRYNCSKVSEAALRAVESEIGFSIPDSYREHLLKIGTGPGPGYGLLPLKARYQNVEEDYYEPVAPSEVPEGVIADFTVLEAGDISRIIERHKLEQPHHLSAICPRFESLHGLHILSHAGCAYVDGIVLAGNMKGSIWSICLDTFEGIPQGIVELEDYEIELLSSGVVKRRGGNLRYSEEPFDFAAWISVWVADYIRAARQLKNTATGQQ